MSIRGNAIGETHGAQSGAPGGAFADRRFRQMASKAYMLDACLLRSFSCRGHFGSIEMRKLTNAQTPPVAPENSH